MAYLLSRNTRHDSCVRLQLPPETAVIGRSTRATIRIDDRSVSKLHATLEPIPGTDRFRVCDMGSRNGIIVDGKRRNEVEIGPGDEVRLGNVVLKLCAEPSDHAGEGQGSGADDTPIRPVGPAPDAGTHGASLGSLLNRSERRLLAVFMVLVVALGLAVWWFPGRTPDPSPAVSDGGEPTGAPAGGPVTAAPDSATPDSATLDAATPPGNIPHRIGSELADPQSIPRDDRRAQWGALARELDARCAGSCHTHADRIEFRESPHEEFGRWERNLLHVRTRAPFEEQHGHWQLGAFGTRGPHRQPMPLELSEPAVAGVRYLRTASGRLLGGDYQHVPYERLAAISPRRVAQLRRVWQVLYGRLPLVREVIAARDRTPLQLLAAARRSPEFWAQRARTTLRGRRGFDAGGGFAVPGVLLPDLVPDDVGDWGRRLRELVDSAPVSAVHPYSADPPLPAGKGEDLEYQGWFLSALSATPRPLPPDAFARSAWGALWGTVPGPRVEARLIEVVGAGLPWRELRARLVTFLVHAPRQPLASPLAEMAPDWVRGLVGLLLGRELGDPEAADIAGRLVDGEIDVELILEECLLAIQSVGAGKGAVAAPPTGVPTLRIEVCCGFPVRELLTRPAEIPRLWKRFQNAVVQTFPVDPMSEPELRNLSLTGALARERLIVSHVGLLPADVERGRVHLADGMLLPALRELADDIGEPRPRAVPAAARRWLRRRLGITTPPAAGVDSMADSPTRALFEHGGFRMLPETWEGAAYRAGTRTLLLASAELGLAPRESWVVWLTLSEGPGGVDPTAWQEFTATLDLLALERPQHHIDLWLWAPARGGGTETVRIAWGPDVPRGWVQRESQYASILHPQLRHLLRTQEHAVPPAGGDGEEGNR